MTARAVLSALPEELDDEWQDIPDTGKTRSILDLDPGWAQAIARSPGRISPLESRRGFAWWPVDPSGSAAAEMIVASLAELRRRQHRRSLAGPRSRRS